MKGIIFDLFESVVTAELGEAIWGQIVDGAGARRDYATDGTYSHEELLALVDEAAIALSKTADETLAWFGRRSIPILASSYPALFTEHTSSVGFVLTLNDVVHRYVQDTFPDAYLPLFDFIQESADTLILSYASYRDLCPFARGMLEGAADYYRETVRIEHFHCQRKGDERCAFLLRIESPERTT